MKLKTLIAITVAIAIIATFVPMPDFARLIFGIGVLAFGVASIITAIRIRKQ